jgi:predicted nucleotidyltransferase
MLNKDYRDILSELSAAGADYLLVGAYALASHGLVRATSDIDLWVRPSAENAERVVAALLAFGAPADQFSAEVLTQPDQVLQIGVAPLRIDFLTSVSGLEFDDSWARRETVDLDGITVPVVCLDDLVANKRATGRPQDIVDLRWIDESQH